MNKRFMPPLTVVMLLGLVGRTWAEEPKKEEAPQKVPITVMTSGHFLVTVMLNGKGPYKLIFDTGAPTLLISPRIAKESGSLDKNTKGAFPLFGMMGQTKVKSLEVGGVKAEDVPAMVMEHPTVQAFSDHYKKDHGPIEGIVGFPFFARYKMTVDYQAKELTLTPNGYKPRDIMESMMQSMMGDRSKPRVFGPEGYWGLTVGKDLSDEEAGVTVKTVLPESPAAKAGLKPGDRVLTIDDRWTDSVGDTYQAVSKVKPGKEIPIVIQRGGKESTLKVTPKLGL